MLKHNGHSEQSEESRDPSLRFCPTGIFEMTDQ